jgi:hypothetical protein
MGASPLDHATPFWRKLSSDSKTNNCPQFVFFFIMNTVAVMIDDVPTTVDSEYDSYSFARFASHVSKRGCGLQHRS